MKLNGKNYRRLHQKKRKPVNVTKLSAEELERRKQACLGSMDIRDPKSLVSLRAAAYEAEQRRRGLPVTGNNVGMSTYGSKTRGK